MRTFVCVFPDESARALLAEFMVQLASFPGYKWVAPENAHVTLRFLGETDSAMAQKMDSHLSRLGGVRPFDIEVGGIGGFPSPENPQQLWLGVRKGAAELEKLAGKAAQAAKNAGFPPGEGRKFKAHLTLARARERAPLSPELAAALGRQPALAWRCRSLAFVKSELTPKGPIYTKIGEYALD